MTTTPDPKTVCAIARKHIRSGRADIGTTIVKHFGNGVLDDKEFFAWEYAVHEVWRTELRAVSWPDERTQGEQECAWHELRLFSGSHPLDGNKVEQHELTHPDQCRTLPPGAACWAEHQPFCWWWPTAHGTYRIRPEDVLTGGSEDGPDYETTLRVQTRGEDGEWFEYTNDIIGADPADETPMIRERLKAGLAEKAAADAAAQDERDGDVRAVAEVVWLTEDDGGNLGVWRDPDNARQQIVRGWAAETLGAYEWVNDADSTHELLMRNGEATGVTLWMTCVADVALEARDAKEA